MSKKIKLENFKKGLKFERLKSGTIVVKREGSHYNTHSEHGRSKAKMECPCCGHLQEYFIWSMAGGGKRCDSCNVILGSGNRAFIDEKNLYKRDVEKMKKLL